MSLFDFNMATLKEMMRRDLVDSLPKFELVVRADHTEMFRRPHSKKRRMRMKWAKRPENHRPAQPLLVKDGNWFVIVHPVHAGPLQKELGRRCFANDTFCRSLPQPTDKVVE